MWRAEDVLLWLLAVDRQQKVRGKAVDKEIDCRWKLCQGGVYASEEYRKQGQNRRKKKL